MKDIDDGRLRSKEKRKKIKRNGFSWLREGGVGRVKRSKWVGGGRLKDAHQSFIVENFMCSTIFFSRSKWTARWIERARKGGWSEDFLGVVW